MGPLLFIIYASDSFHIICKYGLQAHAYADDTQLHLLFKAGNTVSESEAVDLIERCIRDIQDWLAKNKLKINDGKTKFVISGTRQQLEKHSDTHLSVENTPITTTTSVKNLGVCMDPKLSFNTQINEICKSSIHFLYKIAKIRKFLTKESSVVVIYAFITCKLDYCNSLYYGLPVYQIAKLQRVQNAAARVVCAISG